MKFLHISPFLLLAWTMLVCAYQSYTDDSHGGLLFSLTVAGAFCYAANRKYQTFQKEQSDIKNSIAINIGLLPLLYANLLLSNLMLQGKAINESGMVYVLVFIYSPFLYAGTLMALIIYSNWKKKRHV